MIEAHVGGLLVADAGLGGRLFSWSWVDKATAAAPSISPTAGTSAQVKFASNAFLGKEGLWTLLAMRPDGGNVAISWVVEPLDS